MEENPKILTTGLQIKSSNGYRMTTVYELVHTGSQGTVKAGGWGRGQAHGAVGHVLLELPHTPDYSKLSTLPRPPIQVSNGGGEVG